MSLMFRTLRAEQIKLSTLRSTWWSIGLTMAASIGFAILIAAIIPDDDIDTNTASNIGVLFIVASLLALILLMAMAVIVSTSEYRFGQIRMTLAATPSRWQVLASKAIVVMVVAFVVGTITSWISVLFAKTLVPSGFRLNLSDPDAMRVVWGLPLFFAVAALLAMSVGAILRNSPAAITVLAVVPLGVEKTLLVIEKTRHFASYLPFNAGVRITQPRDEDFILPPWTGFGIFCIYTAVFFLVAVILAETRDA
jgi:ABC-2 type transport system permease protein